MIQHFKKQDAGEIKKHHLVAMECGDRTLKKDLYFSTSIKYSIILMEKSSLYIFKPKQPITNVK